MCDVLCADLLAVLHISAGAGRCDPTFTSIPSCRAAIHISVAAGASSDHPSFPSIWHLTATKAASLSGCSERLLFYFIFSPGNPFSQYYKHCFISALHLRSFSCGRTGKRSSTVQADPQYPGSPRANPPRRTPHGLGKGKANRSIKGEELTQHGRVADSTDIYLGRFTLNQHASHTETIGRAISSYDPPRQEMGEAA